MIDYLFSSLPPGKGADFAETGPSSTSIIMANIALVVGTIILRPAIERHIHPAIWGHTPTSLDKRQFFKSVLGRRDLLSPALFKVKPTKPIIATAVTVVKAIPTPVQNFQEESPFLLILFIIACMILVLVGTVLSSQHYRQGASWSSPSAASSDNSDSSLEPYSRDSTPPNDDSSDESSGSGGRPPPVLVFDLFHDFPILHLDKAVGTGDERVRDGDGSPPPPPPSFPSPVEDGDAFSRKPFISKSMSLTLVLSIFSLVIKRFFKLYGKAQNEASTSRPTDSGRITVNEISGDFLTLFPSATPNPVINTNTTCHNLLPLVKKNKLESLSVSTLVTSTISQRSRKFAIAVFSLLFMTCLFGLSFIAAYFLDYHLQRTTNTFLPMEIRRRSLDEFHEITASAVTTSSVSSFPLGPTFESATDDTGGSDEVNLATVDDETEDLPLASPIFAPDTDDAVDSDKVNATTMKSSDSSLSSPEISIQQELSFNDAEDNTLVISGKASALAVDFKDIFNASDDGVPSLEVFGASSISGSSDVVPVSNEEPKASTTLMFGLPSTVNGKGIKVLSEHVPKLNIPILAKKAQPVSVALARSHTLPNCGALVRNNTTNRKPFSMDSKAASFVPPPSPERPGLSASIHAPLPQRKGDKSMNAGVQPPSEEDFCESIYAPSSPGSGANIYAPSSPPRQQDLWESILAPCTSLKRGLNDSIHAPSQNELMPIPVVDLSPDRRIRRVIDPQRECSLVVLVDGGICFPLTVAS